MKLTNLQAYEIEKALIRDRTVDAVRIYREATGCSLSEAKSDVDKMRAELEVLKPSYFRDRGFKSRREHQPETTTRTVGNRSASQNRSFFNRPGRTFFLITNVLIFGAIAYSIMSRNSAPIEQPTVVESREVTQSSAPPQGRPKAVFLPDHVDADDFSAPIADAETLESLYFQKLNDAAYIGRKSSSESRTSDTSVLERKIKTARSMLALARKPPVDAAIVSVARHSQSPTLDGVLEAGEWSTATPLMIDEALGTQMYLQSDGEWLFIACDVPGELTEGGYDQLRVYLHAGLNSRLINERIHIGRGAGVTSIRETDFRWQGALPKTENERWKKFAISDWGIYRYALGASSMLTGHRQYEVAIHLAEAGLHPGAPFTLYAEVETDPLKNEQGKFVERRYLGELGSVSNPRWMTLSD